MAKLLIMHFYSNDTPYIYKITDDTEIEYYVRRRIEKGPGECSRLFLIDEFQELNVSKIVSKIKAKLADELIKQEEQRERAKYKELKAKYDKMD